MCPARTPSSKLALLATALACALLPGCAVVTVASTAVSVGVGVVGLAADAAIGTVRITGKAVGAAADAAFGSDEDTSGITVRYREPAPDSAAPL